MTRGKTRRNRGDSYRSRDYDRRGGSRYSHGKSDAEARAERLTWFFLVLIFALLQLLTQYGFTIQNWIVPLGGGIILISSGLYQYLRRWRVSPVTWLAGALLIVLAFISIFGYSQRSFLGESLVIFAAVILIGLLTGET
jgi:hypothetical protein